MLIHDAARPFLSEAVITRGLFEVGKTGACVAALPARDTIKRVDADRQVIETPPREQLWAVQTPQLFRRDLVLAALAATDDDATDEAALIERIGGTVRVFEGETSCFKITTPDDLEIAQALGPRTDHWADEEDPPPRPSYMSADFQRCRVLGSGWMYTRWRAVGGSCWAASRSRTRPGSPATRMATRWCTPSLMRCSARRPGATSASGSPRPTSAGRAPTA